MPNAIPTVADAENAYNELLAAVQSAHGPNKARAKSCSDGGQLILYSAPCLCGSCGREYFTSVWAEYPPNDCWVAEKIDD